MRAIVFVVGLWLGSPAVAAAGPVAELAADIDGDGAADALRLEAPGQLVIERARGGGQLVAFGASGELTEARLTAGAIGGRRVVVATARIGGRWEAVALGSTKAGAAATELWRGAVGPSGDDEYEQWVAADAGGLWRYQTRADQKRCDGVALELFRERWDDRAAAWVAAPPRANDAPTGAPVVTAKAGGPGLPASWYRAVTTSMASGALDAGALTAPRALGDGDVATSWTAPGDGRDAVWSFRATISGGKAAAIRIVPSGDGDAKRGRAARLYVYSASGGAVIEVPDPIATRAPRGQAYTAVLPTPLDGCVSIALAEAYRGRGGGGIAVAELAVIADVEQTPEGAAPVLVTAVLAGGLAAESAARALVAMGAPAVVAIRARLDGATGDGRGRLLVALAQIRDVGVIGALGDALARGEVPEARLSMAMATLAALGAEGHARLFALIGGAAPSSVQQAAVDALATVDLPGLAGRAGRGDTATRARIARAIAALPVPVLAALAAAATDGDATADLWRAVGVAATTAPAADRAAAIAALEAALAAAGPSYALRYRTLAALAPLVDGDALTRLAKTLAALPASAAGHALTRVAARGLGKNPAPGAQPVLATLAAAADPGVRLEAVRALATDAHTDTADGAVVTVLGGDRWPALRQAAAAGLALRCTRPGPRTALITAVGTDAHVPVRVEAVAALASCVDGAVATQFLTWVDDSTLALPVRDRALAAYAEQTGPAATAALLTRLARWRGQAFSDDAALRLAIRAATALGQRAAAEAGAELLAAARDRAFPELATAAVQALGGLGAACPREAPALLRSLLGADEAQLATAARGALRTCR